MSLFHKMNICTSVAALTVALTTGCAIDADTDAAADDPAADLVAEATQASTTLSGCEYTVDLRTESQTVQVPISTASYAVRNCLSFQLRAFTGGHDWRAYVSWNGVNLDADPDVCEDSLVFATLSRATDGSWANLGTKTDHGAWGHVIGSIPVAGGSLPLYGCNPPDVDWGLADHHTYALGVFGNLAGFGAQGVYVSFVPLN